jgi:hypothetical protein
VFITVNKSYGNRVFSEPLLIKKVLHTHIQFFFNTISSFQAGQNNRGKRVKQK